MSGTKQAAVSSLKRKSENKKIPRLLSLLKCSCARILENKKEKFVRSLIYSYDGKGNNVGLLCGLAEIKYEIAGDDEKLEGVEASSLFLSSKTHTDGRKSRFFGADLMKLWYCPDALPKDIGLS